MLHILSILIIFFALLALLVLTHEAGHFFMCRVLGVIVEEFGFGLPPRLIGLVKLQDKKKKKFWKIIRKYSKIHYEHHKVLSPIYSLNAIPFGGFVKILGEDGEAKSHPKSFSSQTVGKRFLILFAGIAMNVLLGIFLFTIGYWSGFPEIVEDDLNIPNAKVQVLNIAPGSPAETAGIKMGDSIRAVITPNKDRISIDKVSTLQTVSGEFAGQSIILETLRGNDVYRFNVEPRLNPPEGQGPLGIYPARIGIVRYPVFEALKISIGESFQLIWVMADYLGTIINQFFHAQKVALDLSGPVGIVVLTNQFREMGFPYLLKFAGLISLNLAFINFIPYPALDGGRILFLLIEKIKGRPVSPKLEQVIHTVGMYSLLLLMVLITFHDVSRFHDKFVILWEKLQFWK